MELNNLLEFFFHLNGKHNTELNPQCDCPWPF